MPSNAPPAARGTGYAVATSALLVIALGATLLPWHEVREIGPMGRPELERCTGLDHVEWGGDLLLYGAAALHVLALLARRRPRVVRLLGAGAVGLVAGALFFVEDVWLGRAHALSSGARAAPGLVAFLGAAFAYVLAPLLHRLWVVARSSDEAPSPAAPGGAAPVEAGEGAPPPRSRREAVTAALGLGCAVLSLAGYALPWHDVHGIHGGLGVALFMGPDFHPDLTPALLGTCTGKDHAGALGLLAVLAVLGLQTALLGVSRRPVRRALALAAFVVASLATLQATWVVFLSDLGHLFENTVERGGGYVYGLGLLGCVVVASWQAFGRPRAAAPLRG